MPPAAPNIATWNPGAPPLARQSLCLKQASSSLCSKHIQNQIMNFLFLTNYRTNRNKKRNLRVEVAGDSRNSVVGTGIWLHNSETATIVCVLKLWVWLVMYKKVACGEWCDLGVGVGVYWEACKCKLTLSQWFHRLRMNELSVIRFRLLMLFPAMVSAWLHLLDLHFCFVFSLYFSLLLFYFCS